MSDRKKVVLVAAVADNGVIGRDGALPWHLPGDLAHFRQVTSGNTVVMGRVTFESIGRPLPRRTNIVVTRRPGWSADGVLVADSLPRALELAQPEPGDVMVVGGAQVYAEAMDLADEQVLTEVHQAPPGDTYYPDFDRTAWTETRRERQDGYDFVWWERSDR
ncbi:MAG TPA: dihydrofolate reductase [Nocardioidaceae bacterium]|nr:dihydrofolate reductase [Nocardioidaceae bacterium]